MSPLRLRMLEHMRLRHYSPRTIKSYLAQVAAFARHLGRSPDTATLEEVSAYLLCLEERGMSQSLLSNAYSGIKMLFVAVLDRAWAVLPSVLRYHSKVEILV
jgi:integrase/recombinase XerD